jgi:hypothetical protein
VCCRGGADFDFGVPPLSRGARAGALRRRCLAVPPASRSAAAVARFLPLSSRARRSGKPRARVAHCPSCLSLSPLIDASFHPVGGGRAARARPFHTPSRLPVRRSERAILTRVLARERKARESPFDSRAALPTDGASTHLFPMSTRAGAMVRGRGGRERGGVCASPEGVGVAFRDLNVCSALKYRKRRR